MLSGQNGILNRAVEAKENIKVKSENELKELTKLESITNIENREYVDSEGNKAIIPAGFAVSQIKGENTIEDGLVIIDNRGNEFVWIPVTKDFESLYEKEAYYSEPIELTSNYSDSGAKIDSQETLDYLYGEGLYNYDTDFAYADYYNEMVEKVNQYKGFYIGRYETTVNTQSGIGSQYNTTVLTANSKINKSNNDKSNLWWGLYESQRKSNVQGNEKYIQTNMICGQQWDAMIEYFNATNKDYSAWGISKDKTVIKSGQSVNYNNEKDVICNIYDLRTNGWELTLEAYHTYCRVVRGGHYGKSENANFRYYGDPYNPNGGYVSRLAFYIK